MDATGLPSARVSRHAGSPGLGSKRRFLAGGFPGKARIPASLVVVVVISRSFVRLCAGCSPIPSSPKMRRTLSVSCADILALLIEFEQCGTIERAISEPRLEAIGLVQA